MMDVSEVQSLISQKVPVAEFLGLKVEHIEPGHVRVQLPFSRQVQNHLEIVYAGAIFALAEITGGMAMLSVLDTSQFTILIERLNIEFLRPSRRDLWCDVLLDQTLLQNVQAEVKAEGRGKFSIPIQIIDERHRIIASIQADYYLRHRK